MSFFFFLYIYIFTFLYLYLNLTLKRKSFSKTFSKFFLFSSDNHFQSKKIKKGNKHCSNEKNNVSTGHQEDGDFVQLDTVLLHVRLRLPEQKLAAL
jgi:hypothetical protein